MSCKILSDSDHIARKQHPCVWCREPIEPGEQYHVQTCIFECEWQSNKYHTECFEAAYESWADGDSEFRPHSFKRGTSEEWRSGLDKQPAVGNTAARYEKHQN